MDPLKLLLDRGLLLSDSLTSQGRFIEVSAEQTDQLGYAPGSLDGQAAELIYTADSLNALMQLFANPPADERVQDLELTLIRHNGGLLPVLASGVLQWRDGEPARLHLVKMPLGPVSRRSSPGR